MWSWLLANLIVELVAATADLLVFCLRLYVTQPACPIPHSVCEDVTEQVNVCSQRNGFATDVMPTVMCIVAATADLLVWLSQTLRAVPSKPHYTFSLRDFAKLIYSHLLVKRENIDSKRVFIR